MFLLFLAVVADDLSVDVVVLGRRPNRFSGYGFKRLFRVPYGGGLGLLQLLLKVGRRFLDCWWPAGMVTYRDSLRMPINTHWKFFQQKLITIEISNYAFSDST